MAKIEINDEQLLQEIRQGKMAVSLEKVCESFGVKYFPLETTVFQITNIDDLPEEQKPCAALRKVCLGEWPAAEIKKLLAKSKAAK
jgi:hypothetical protein